MASFSARGAVLLRTAVALACSVGCAIGASAAEVIFQAESFTSSSGAGFNTLSDAAALGGSAITTLGDTTGAAPDATAAFSLNFTATGTYYLYSRYKTDSEGGSGGGTGNLSDSLFIPGGFGTSPTFVTINALVSVSDPNVFTWTNLTTFADPDVTYSVGSPGTFDFVIGGREDGFTIDAFVFSTNNSLSSAALDALFPNLWDGSASNAWTNAANWSDGVPGTGSTAEFYDSGASNLATDFNGSSFSLNTLRFNSGATSPVTIDATGGETLTLTGAGGMVLDVQAGSHAFLGDGTNSSADDWIFSGAAGSSYTLNVEGGATFTIDGRIGQGSTTDLYFKTGDGTLVLSADNGGSGSWNFSGGGFTISDGILQLTDNGAQSGFGGASGLTSNPFTVANGATLELKDHHYQSSNGTLTLNGPGHGGVGALHSLQGDNNLNNQANPGSGSVVLASDASIGVSADSLTINQPITGPGGLAKVGGGDLILTNSANNYAGATNIDAGRLLVNGTLLDPGGDVNINSGGTLGGTGPIERHVNLFDGGTHAVGNSIGAQTVASETWNGGGTVEIEFDDFLGVAGTNWDLLTVTGDLTVNASEPNSVIIKLISLDPSNDNFSADQDYFALLFGDSTGLIDFDPSFFTFDTTMFGHDLEGGQFSVSTDGNGGVFLNFNSAAVVPEPQSIAIWCLLTLIAIAYTGRLHQRRCRSVRYVVTKSTR